MGPASSIAIGSYCGWAGLKGDFNEHAPWFDKQLGAINMAKMPIHKDAVTRLIDCATAG